MPTESNTVLQTSKLTTKYQATVPTSVRKVLQLKAGDMLAFEINGDEVKLRRATPLGAWAAEGVQSENRSRRG